MPVRIYEISRKWGIRSADLVERLSDLGVGVTSHVSAIGEDDVAILAKDIVRRPIKPSKKKQRKPAIGKFEPISIFREEPVVVEAPTAPVAEAPAGEPVAAQAAGPAAETAPTSQDAEREGLTVKAAASEVDQAAPVSAEKAAEEAQAAGQPEGEAGKEPQRRMIVLPPQKGAKEQRPAVVDETLLREQIAQATQVAQRESEEESRILRKIVLPPHKRAKKKRKVPTSLDRARSPRIIAPSRPEKVELHGSVTIRDFSQASGIKSGRHRQEAHGPRRDGERQPAALGRDSRDARGGVWRAARDQEVLVRRDGARANRAGSADAGRRAAARPRS